MLFQLINCIDMLSRKHSTSHKIRKPTLFISHATSDAEFANVIKQETERVFAKGLDVFCTSSPGAISAGVDWLADIEHKLDVSQAIIAIVTPISIERPWLWFEIGASWLKGRSGDCRIYPLCAPEVSVSKLPVPLDRLQALSMGNPQDIRSLFAALVEQFGFGSQSSLRVSRITSKIPKYTQVELVRPDLDDQNLARGSEKFTVPARFDTEKPKGQKEIAIALSWDFWFGFLGGALFESGHEHHIYLHFRNELAAVLPDDYVRHFPKGIGQKLWISNAVIRQIEIQFMALGLIEPYEKAHWRLTPHGLSYLLKVKSIKSEVE